MKKVAVIILNWNGAELLRRYLPTVIAGTDDAIADIIGLHMWWSSNSAGRSARPWPSRT